MTPETVDHPAFEVRCPNGATYRIWASGRVEGFGEAPVILNRIPLIVSKAVAKVVRRAGPAADDYLPPPASPTP